MVSSPPNLSEKMRPIMRKNRQGKASSKTASRTCKASCLAKAPTTKGKEGAAAGIPPRRQCSGARRPRTPSPPPPLGHGTQFGLRWRLCPHRLCVISLQLLRASVREVSSSTPQSHRDKKTASQFCSLAASVSAWVLQGKARMQGQETCFKKRKQGFSVKMESKHFAGPRNILQTKGQGFCVLFLSILKIGPIGPTTGHWTENWSLYLIRHFTITDQAPTPYVRLRYEEPSIQLIHGNRHRNDP